MMIKVERVCPHICISMKGDSSYRLLHERKLPQPSFDGEESPEWPCKACNSSTCSHTEEALTPTPFSFAAAGSRCNLRLLTQLPHMQKQKQRSRTRTSNYFRKENWKHPKAAYSQWWSRGKKRLVVLPDLKGSREVRKEMRIRAMTATFRPCGCVVEEAISMGWTFSQWWILYICMLIISEERRSEGNCSLEFEGMGVRVECFFENGGVRSEERVIGNGVLYWKGLGQDCGCFLKKGHVSEADTHSRKINEHLGSLFGNWCTWL